MNCITLWDKSETIPKIPKNLKNLNESLKITAPWKIYSDDEDWIRMLHPTQ